MIRLTALLLALLLATPAAAAPDPVGRWTGTLDAGAVQLRVRFNISGEPGSLKVTMDSLDQGVEGMPARIEVDGARVVIRVSSVSGRFAGTLADDGASLVGQWSQLGNDLPLALKRQGAVPGDTGPSAAAIAAQPHGSELPGVWLGTLTAGMVELRLQFHVTETDGELDVAMDSLDQGANGIPGLVELKPDRAVRFGVPSTGGHFAGVLDAAGDTLRGEWAQAGRTFDLVLGREGAATVLNRPQEPQPPFPYREVEVSFAGGAEDVTLAGTLTVPEGDGPFPAAVLVSGSGPQDRNEELLGHKPFLVLADHLTRAGIAVLRYDDRGAAASTGDFSSATTADFAADAGGAVAFLRDQPEIDAAAIGIVGHSEGGLVAPLVATARDDLAYIVMLAGPGVKGRDVLVHQTGLLLRGGGSDEETVGSEVAALTAAVDIVAAEDDPAKARAQIVAELVARTEAAGDEPDSVAINAMATRITGPWFRWFLDFDPVPTLQAVSCPVLAVWGSLDLQVDPAQNRPPVEAALAAGVSPRWQARVFDGLNHLFQPATTGAMSEYAQIETTMAPELLTAVSEWVLAITGEE